MPGNALVVNADSPYRAFSKFGVDFLNKFEGSFCDSKFLESVTLIDTPGILAGEKQVAGRGYDYNEVVAKFAESCDLILLLFDANKTDIGDEMRNARRARAAGKSARDAGERESASPHEKSPRSIDGDEPSGELSRERVSAKERHRGWRSSRSAMIAPMRRG